jgi:hypothetical protein
VVTEIHNPAEAVVTTVPAGATVHDKATVSGSFGTPTGTVTFRFFTNGTCTSPAVADAVPDKVTLDGSGVAHPSASRGPLSVAAYSFQAHYNGEDLNYLAADGPCERLDVVRIVDVFLTTVAHPTNGTVGTPLNDEATLTGTVLNATGTITFNLYAPGVTCPSGPPSYTDVVSVSGNGTYSTTSGNHPGGFSSNAAGTWRWTADYSGDANNGVASSGCTEEPVTITSPVARLTPGYWKNHQAQTTALLPYTLGNYSVGDFAAVTAVFNAMNCGIANNQSQSAVACLAGHLLAAKLNVKNGADGCIVPTIAAADAFLISIGYSGPTSSYPTLTATQRSTAISLKTTLDQYNNNISCP